MGFWRVLIALGLFLNFSSELVANSCIDHLHQAMSALAYRNSDAFMRSLEAIADDSFGVSEGFDEARIALNLLGMEATSRVLVQHPSLPELYRKFYRRGEAALLADLKKDLKNPNVDKVTAFKKLETYNQANRILTAPEANLVLEIVEGNSIAKIEDLSFEDVLKRLYHCKSGDIFSCLRQVIDSDNLGLALRARLAVTMALRFWLIENLRPEVEQSVEARALFEELRERSLGLVEELTDPDRFDVETLAEMKWVKEFVSLAEAGELPHLEEFLKKSPFLLISLPVGYPTEWGSMTLNAYQWAQVMSTKPIQEMIERYR